MSWTNELYNVYDLALKAGSADDDRDESDKLLPVSHSTANAQIEITVDEHSNFKGAHIVNKEDAVTIIPVTEDSGARSSGICPMPFADKLVYIAEDYPEYTETKNSDNKEYFGAYISQLEEWENSGYSHPAVSAVLKYLKRSVIMDDLIKSGVLQVDTETGKLLPKAKIAGIAQEDSFVRFVVQYDDLTRETRTWCDKTLFDSFIGFNNSRMGDKILCYATGKMLLPTYKHPSKIRNSGDKAKLISSNDESGFTYRGRFSDKEEALSVSYEFSQKMHNALKWLIKKQGRNYGSLTLVTWASAFEDIPDVLGADTDEDEWDDEELYDSLPLYKEKLRKHIMEYKQDFSNNTKVMVMGLDAATTGRLSIAMYYELYGSEFLDNIESWHDDSAWMRFDISKKKNKIRSFGLYEIIKSAYGNEQNGRLECDDKIVREQMLRLIPCVISRRQIPSDLINALYYKASNPLAYEKKYNHRTVIEVICGMIRAEAIRDKSKGEPAMSYDPNIKDRSYLYGCLLAVADIAEREAFDKEDRDNRVTNARRYWNEFSQHPYRTWGIIEKNLNIYLIKLKTKQIRYQKWINEIMGKMTVDMFAKDTRLDNTYLLGYHHFTAYMYSGAKKEEK